MDTDELWIGERLKLLKSGKIGTYEGQNPSGKLRIKWKDGIILTTIENVTVAAPEEIDDQRLEAELSTKKPRCLTSSQIDLHINQNDIRLSREPQMILRAQLNMCQEFLSAAIENRFISVTIIHGKGLGELRKEVHHILDNNDRVKSYHLMNDGGATEVLLL